MTGWGVKCHRMVTGQSVWMHDMAYKSVAVDVMAE